ncbi:MAG: hypothetical protein QNJ97_14045 [Myxococcota bacterium]|nr:hypothetical protein [Myxococcota bacterium]
MITAQAAPQDPTPSPATADADAALPLGEETKKDAAQEQDNEQDTKAQDSEAAALNERLQALEAKTEQQQQRNEALQEKVNDLTERLDQSELDALQAELSETESANRFLDIYGFFDVNLYYYQIEKGEMPHGIFPESFSFSVSQLNLYFLSQMTETLSALIELRFSFLPQGHEKSYEMEMLGTEYERIDMTVLDMFTGREFQLGGVAIERVHLTYAPRDWFNVIAGHFLTPFGIWNVDHGSPVRLLVRDPYFMSFQHIPINQTGLQVFGRFFPMSHLYLDYAVTLSNGRGSTETVYDLNNNKAIGLRLKGTYEGKENSLSLGGYFYYGETTDVAKSLELNSHNDLEFSVETTENYTEILSSFDLVLELSGFKLQVEYAGGIVRYDERPPLVYFLINAQDPLGKLRPDFIKWGIYGLVSYEFVFNVKESSVRLIPFFMTEYCEHDDTALGSPILVYRGGLNLKPSSFITLKYELVHVGFPETKLLNDFWIHSGQLAISF